jgi:excisionase family DNA binding protein
MNLRKYRSQPTEVMTFYEEDRICRNPGSRLQRKDTYRRVADAALDLRHISSVYFGRQRERLLGHPRDSPRALYVESKVPTYCCRGASHTAKRRRCGSSNPRNIIYNPLWMDDTPKSLGIDECAAFLKIDTSTAYELAACGEIPGAKIGRAWVFLEYELTAYLRAQIQRQTQQRRLKVRTQREATPGGLRTRRGRRRLLPVLPTYKEDCGK